MSVKPILFNTDEVRAILAVRKTATRRVVKYAEPDWRFLELEENPCSVAIRANGEEYPKELSGLYAVFEGGDTSPYDFPMVRAPYRPGDILYVRETWNFGYFDSSDAELDNSQWFEPLPLDYDRDSYIGSLAGFVYRADFTRAEEYEYGTMDESNKLKPMPWYPSIHMPRESARIWLRVTDVRVERVQEISDADVEREGVHGDPYTFADPEFYDRPELRDNYGKAQFAGLWDGTIKPTDRDRYGWAANPFCWVISFERISKDKALGGGMDD